ncbi:MAG: response regulator, partial [Actinomycetota bacterium]
MPRILIAEDDRRVRESLERALTLEGYDVVTAGDGAKALELHADQPADLLLLDVSMPNADGLSVCRRIRERGDDTPVLMLT